MKNEKQVLRIELTTEEKEQLRDATGKNAEAIELTVKELEQRIAPGVYQNHNETFLLETLMRGDVMRNDKEIVRIDLSQSQTEKLKARIGKDVGAIELTVHELEERVAPRLGSNCNETLLMDRR